MKYYILLYLCLLFHHDFINCNKCFEFNIQFGNDDCRNISPELLTELYHGKQCKDFVCTMYFDILRAHICIHKKDHEYKLMILGQHENLTFDISTFKENEEYSIKKLAISGSHFSVLLNNQGDAYRQSYDYKNLSKILINQIPLIEIGYSNVTTWIPGIDSDSYYEDNFKNVVQYLHNNTKMEKVNVNKLLEERCMEWKSSMKYDPDLIPTTTTTTPVATTPETSTLITSSLTTLSTGVKESSNFSWIYHVAVSGVTALIVFAFVFLMYRIRLCCKKRGNNNLQSVRYVPPGNIELPPPSYQSRTINDSSRYNNSAPPPETQPLTENNDSVLGAIYE